MKTIHSVVSCRRPVHFPTLFFVAILLIGSCLVRPSYGFDDKALQEVDGNILRYSSAWTSSFSQWPGSINKIGEMDEPMLFSLSSLSSEGRIRVALAQSEATSVFTPEIELDPDEKTHDFGNIPIGRSQRWTLWVRNKGNINLEVVCRLDEKITDYTIVQGEGESVIRPSEDMKVVAKFTPGTEGNIEDRLVILSNDPKRESIQIALIGKGLNLERQRATYLGDYGLKTDRYRPNYGDHYWQSKKEIVFKAIFVTVSTAAVVSAIALIAQ